MAGISSRTVNVGGYGSSASGNCGCLNKKEFNGNEKQEKEFSDGSGIEVYDFNARTYDQQIGKFIQIDPLIEFGGQESLTPYQFAYNNPLRYNDPDGRCPLCLPLVYELGKDLLALGVAYFATKHIVDNSKNITLPEVRINLGSPDGNAFIPLSAQIAQKRNETAQSEKNNSQSETGPTTSNVNSGSNDKKGPAPNNGNTKKHGGTNHNEAIDNKVNELNNDGNVINIRKNQQQVDATGKKVGTNRPDVQYDKYNEQTGKWEHHVVEYDAKTASSKAHGTTIKKNDPRALIQLNVL